MYQVMRGIGDKEKTRRKGEECRERRENFEMTGVETGVAGTGHEEGRDCSVKQACCWSDTKPSAWECVYELQVFILECHHHMHIFPPSPTSCIKSYSQDIKAPGPRVPEAQTSVKQPPRVAIVILEPSCPVHRQVSPLAHSNCSDNRRSLKFNLYFSSVFLHDFNLASRRCWWREAWGSELGAARGLGREKARGGSRDPGTDPGLRMQEKSSGLLGRFSAFHQRSLSSGAHPANPCPQHHWNACWLPPLSLPHSSFVIQRAKKNMPLKTLDRANSTHL